MDEQVRRAKAAAVYRLSRSPGFRELVELLEECAGGVSQEAFGTEDDSRAVHLFYEARGARRVVNTFQNRVSAIADEMMQEMHGSGS